MLPRRPSKGVQSVPPLNKRRLGGVTSPPESPFAKGEIRGFPNLWLLKPCIAMRLRFDKFTHCLHRLVRSQVRCGFTRALSGPIQYWQPQTG